MNIPSRYLRLIDHETTGNRSDVTPLFADAIAFSQLLAELTHQLAGTEFDAIAAVDALGIHPGDGAGRQDESGD